MPNDRRSSTHNYRVSPYNTRYNKNSNQNTIKSPIGNENEWEETRCCICMDHPHNAVLLLCSSRAKGCLPYICDTSARHSNCLDQFRKTCIDDEGQENELVCPLCRGQINKWIVVKPAREFMNLKTRSCSMGSCDFSGNYSELREHARRDHPCVRPTDVDPKRELEWMKLEQEMEQQDILSMQFEFDDDDDVDDDDDELETMDGFYELNDPIWDWDPEYFFTAFESEFGNIFPELDYAGDPTDLVFDDLDSVFNLSSSELARIEYGWSRGPISNHNGLFGTPRDNARVTRSRSNTHRRNGRPRSNSQRSNSQPSSHNRQEQVTTLVDFHELRSNMP